MKVFKSKQLHDLDESKFKKGDILVTKALDINSGFEVNELEGKDPYLTFKSKGTFIDLSSAISFANYIESNIYKYEYYCQVHVNFLEEGGEGRNLSLDVISFSLIFPLPDQTSVSVLSCREYIA